MPDSILQQSSTVTQQDNQPNSSAAQQDNSSIHVGIDLGTTNTVLAVCKRPRLNKTPNPKIREIKQFVDPKNQGNMLNLPSVLFFDFEGNVKVGEYARIRKTMGADRRVLYNTKIDMGTKTVYQNDFTPIKAAAEILKVCYATIEHDITPRGEAFPSVTITVPASFDQNQIADTVAAASRAGFKNVSILEEPVAALYHYINEQNISGDETAVDFSETKRVLVYDIGGGTCDVCVVDLKINEDGTYDIHFVVTNRYTEFGGNDFDEQAAIGLLNKLFNRYNIKEDSVSNDLMQDLVAQVLAVCELYKIEFSGQLNNRFSVNEIRDATPRALKEFIGGIKNVELDLSYKEYMEYTKIFFDHSYRRPTRDLTDKLRNKNVFSPVHQVLKKLKALGERGIDCVFLTGGMSRYLPIETALKDFCKCPLIKSDEPMKAVALGAALSKFIKANKVNDGFIIIPNHDDNETSTPVPADTRDERPRLAEAIFIDVENQLPMKIIDANITIPCKGTVDHEFHVGANGVRVHLFAGQSQWDPEMRILYDHSQIFQSLVQPGTVAHVNYEIDEDRVLKLTLQLEDEFKQEVDLTVDNIDP